MPDNLLYYGDPGAPGLAYLANIAPRLVELRRALNPTGSLYLHCDPPDKRVNARMRLEGVPK